MKITEEEAKQKRCPQSMGGVKFYGCIGSGCMAWRWFGLMINDSRPEKVGYCGLAGKPEGDS